MVRFFQVALRTTDVDAARQFHGSVSGDDSGAVNIVKLHEQAAARGAPPHWLWFLEVEDVVPAAAAFVARGAHRRGHAG